MKLLLAFILGLCLAVAYGSKEVTIDSETRSVVLTKSQSVIKSMIEKIKEIANNLFKRATEIFTNLSEKIQSLVVKSKERIEQDVEKIMKNIERKAGETKAAVKCVADGRHNVAEILKTSFNDMNGCGAKSINESLENLYSIKEYLDKISDNTDALNDIVSECLETNWNPIKAFSCVLEESKEIKENCFGIINNIKDSIKNSTKKSIEIMKTTNSCIIETTKSTYSEIANIKKNILKCIKSV